MMIIVDMAMLALFVVFIGSRFYFAGVSAEQNGTDTEKQQRIISLQHVLRQIKHAIRGDQAGATHRHHLYVPLCVA